ncbi:ABC transporter substrate-binding protein [Pseudonocardia oroxyli]|uniref:Amino acid ABC transporter substrate-binding protein, PAAT family n=1 Tax=Pseudonocardia oroxyli TaxID=366584 RepID=A0A1G8E9B0_PSEOR|nr:ABC transporter substrate-binding protein [Pseudonocardia oroxyli]SDH66451.1 amino acid ABC transporter substrate-binding protein, PAAT family [Pseudonocardia oroxyli]
MSRIPRPLRHLRLVAVALALPLLATIACAGPDPDQAAPPGGGATVNTSPDQNRVRAQKDDAIAATLPQAIRERGTLVVGTTGNGTPPLSFTADDDRTIIGVEPDIAQLVADKLGLRLELQPTSWENLFLATESGQYDAGFSNVTVTEERKDKYDFATYRTDTIAFEARTDGPVEKIAEPKDVAGLTIGVGAGTNQEQLLVRWDEQNRAAGLAPTTIQYYQNPGDFYLALDSGRLDAYLGPNPTSAYHVATGGTTKIVGTLNGGGDVQADIAAMTKKGNGLVQPLAAALNALREGGEYQQVLQRWNLSAEAVPTSQVNPQGLPRKAAS